MARQLVCFNRSGDSTDLGVPHRNNSTRSLDASQGYAINLTLTDWDCRASIVPMIEVDQSQKIERMEKDTILALSNKYHYVIRIPSSVKRNMFQRCLLKGKSRKSAYIWIFAAGVFLLLEPHLPNIIRRQEIIMIDVEYTGQDANIKSMIMRHCYQAGLELTADNIRFAQIGKASGAHKLAYAVQTGKARASKRIGIGDLLALM